MAACAWACTPAQLSTLKADAQIAAPYLQAGCALAPDTGPAAPYLDLLCAGAEAVDAALSKLPPGTAAIVAVSPPVPAAPPALPAAVPQLTVYRLRVLLHTAPPPRVVLDAGAAVVLDAAGG